MRPSRLWILCDRLLLGQLETELRRWRRAGVSAPAMARLLEDQLGVSISRETIRRWLLELDNGEGAAA